MAVELYLIRHGIAALRGEEYPDDTKRPLTHRGIVRLRREARALAALNVSFDQIITSPLVRARQTADLFAEDLPSKPPVAVSQSLAPGGKPGAVLDELGKYARRTKIALVGHEPDLGELAARMIGARQPIQFKKGGICRIDFEALPPAGPGRLRWLMTPKQLRALVKGEKG